MTGPHLSVQSGESFWLLNAAVKIAGGCSSSERRGR